MTAGTGIIQNEFNPPTDKVVHLLYIWIFPDEEGLILGYEQKNYKDKLNPNQLCLISSRECINDSAVIHQDVDIYTCILEKEKSIEYAVEYTGIFSFRLLQVI